MRNFCAVAYLGGKPVSPEGLPGVGTPGREAFVIGDVMPIFSMNQSGEVARPHGLLLQEMQVMDANIICSVVSPVLGFYQGFLDLFFGFISFIGIPAPSISSLVGGVLGCAA
jgi:hypothetical protein